MKKTVYRVYKDNVEITARLLGERRLPAELSEEEIEQAYGRKDPYPYAELVEEFSDKEAALACCESIRVSSYRVPNAVPFVYAEVAFVEDDEITIDGEDEDAEESVETTGTWMFRCAAYSEYGADQDEEDE